MALDKLVDSAQLDSDLTSVANAIRAKGGTSAQLAFPTGFVDAIDAIETGGGSGWQRPAEWPDYSKLRLAENETEALFLTYDNRNPPTTYGLNCNNSIYDRVRIEDDGSVTVLESGIAAGGTFSSEMGDYVCIRVTPQSGKHITGVSMDGGGASSNYFGRHRCLERYGFLPYCTQFGTGYTYRDWNNDWVQSDTLLKTADTVSRISYNGIAGKSVNLKNLYIGGNPIINYASFSGTSIDHLPDAQFAPVSSNSQLSLNFEEMLNITGLDLSGVDFSGVVGNGKNNYMGGFSNCKNLKWVRMPSNMNNMTVGIYDTFNGCARLETVEFDSSYSQLLDVRVFSGCFNMQALIFRSNTVVPLGGLNCVNSFLVTNGGYLFVPASVLEDYKAATNWSSLSEYILPIEGSYWETHHADGSLIEEGAT